MPAPRKYKHGELNLAYVDYLEKEVKKIDRVRSAISLAGTWIKDQTIDPSPMYLACIRDIRRHIK